MMQKMMNLLGVSSHAQVQPEATTSYMQCRRSASCIDGDAYMCDSTTGTCRRLGANACC